MSISLVYLPLPGMVMTNSLLLEITIYIWVTSSIWGFSTAMLVYQMVITCFTATATSIPRRSMDLWQFHRSAGIRPLPPSWEASTVWQLLKVVVHWDNKPPKKIWKKQWHHILCLSFHRINQRWSKKWISPPKKSNKWIWARKQLQETAFFLVKCGGGQHFLT